VRVHGVHILRRVHIMTTPLLLAMPVIVSHALDLFSRCLVLVHFLSARGRTLAHCTNLEHSVFLCNNVYNAYLIFIDLWRMFFFII